MCHIYALNSCLHSRAPCVVTMLYIYIHTCTHARIQKMTFQKEEYLGMALNSEVPNTLPPEMQFSKLSFSYVFVMIF